jgi:hypothetical protein
MAKPLPVTIVTEILYVSAWNSNRILTRTFNKFHATLSDEQMTEEDNNAR